MLFRSPEKLQLLSYNSTYKTKNDSEINIELAASNKDKNLFSSLEDSDNTGIASKVNYISEKNLDKFNLITELDVNYIEDNFNSVERIYNTEFNRDWDLNENISGNYNQLLTKGILELNNEKIGVLNYSFENLKYGDLFRGIRNNLNINSNKNRNLKLNSKNSFMQSDQNDYSSDFINSNNYIQQIGRAHV